MGGPMALKPDLIRKIVRHVRKTVRGRKAAPAERFVRAYYSHVTLDDIRAAAPEDLCATALSLFDLATTRRLGTAKIRVFNPGREKPSRQKNAWNCPHTVVEDLSDVQGALTEHVLRHGGKAARKATDKQVAAWIEGWIEARRHAVGRHEQTMGELRAAAGIDLSMLAVASRNVSGRRGG